MFRRLLLKNLRNQLKKEKVRKANRRMLKRRLPNQPLDTSVNSLSALTVQTYSYNGNAGRILPVHSPNPTPAWVFPLSVTVSPSCRKVRVFSPNLSGFFPPQVIYMRHPRLSFSVPLIVPVPKRSPGFMGHPLTE